MELFCSCSHTADQVAGLEDCARCDSGECIATPAIDPTTIKRVYSGKPGCGCGCRGNYFTDQRNINRVVKAINAGRHSEDFRLQDDGVIDGDVIYALETETRYYWAYTADR